MLERTDRLALAVPDVDAAISTYARIFDCTVVDDRRDVEAGARRVTLQWGQDQLELLEPQGPGPVLDFLQRERSGIFAGGFSLADPAALANRLEDKGIKVHQQEADRFIVFPDDFHGIGIILSRRVDRDRVGLSDKIWQITYAGPGLTQELDRCTDLFDLATRFTNQYTSEQFGYDGAITWFDARDGGLLDSLEYLEPTDPHKAVARFVKRNGSGIYMASIETDEVEQIKARIERAGPGWSGTEFGGFIHPRRLHGLLIALVTYDNWNAKRPLPGGSR